MSNTLLDDTGPLVLQTRLQEITGMTKYAFDALRQRGKVRQRYHWLKSNDRIWFYKKRFYEWLEDTQE
jgi:hypothetical protein